MPVDYATLLITGAVAAAAAYLGWRYFTKKSKPTRKVSLTQTNIPKFTFDQIKESPEQQELFRQWLSTEGFVVFQLDDIFVKLVEDYWEKSSKFFDNDQAYKEQFKGIPKYKDEVFKDRKVNKGYLCVDEKEYLKLSRDDKTQKIPDGLEPSFLNLCVRMEREMTEVYRVAASAIDPKTKKTVHAPDTIKTLADYFSLGSSVSMINYHPLPKKDVRPDTRDSPSDESHYPSGTHMDTGVLTLIICSEVPALQIQDRVTKEWFMPELVCTPKREAFVIVGTKFNLMGNAGSTRYPATVHRVALPYETQRNSLLYFQDLPQ